MAQWKLLGEALTRIRAAVGKERGVAGIVECPKCNGKLHYSVARLNGHIWGQCQTAGCLAWMQ